MFSGGTYDEVARWLGNFLTSHAKRENPRAEVLVEVSEEREGHSYGVRLRLGNRLGSRLEFDYREVAANRATLAWCRDLASRVRGWVRELANGPGAVLGRSE
jgi:hypothetical protein